MLKKLNYIFDRKQKRKIVWILFLVIVGSFVELLGVSVFLPFVQILMDTETIHTNKWLAFFYELLHFGDVRSYLTAMALLIILVYIVKNIYLMLMQNEMLKFSYNTRMELATRLLSTYMSEPYSFHLQKNSSELLSAIQYDAYQFMQLINSSLQLLAEIAVTFCLCIFLFNTSHSITLVIMFLLCACFGSFFVISRNISQKLGKQNEEYNAQQTKWINQALGGIKELKVLGREDFFLNSFRDVYKKIVKGTKNNELLSVGPKYLIETVCMTGMLIAVIVKMYFGQNNIEAFVLQLSAFAVAAFRLMPSAGKINSYINSIMYCRSSLDLIYCDLKSIENCPVVDFVKRSEKRAVFDNEITLNNISFSYMDGMRDILSKVSLTINKGETVAFIGPSGAGKTTLADLVLGLHVPTAGEVLIDGKNIWDEIDEYHHIIGYIPQTIYLSDDSIRNNVAFGVSSEMIDDDAVLESMDMAQIKDFVLSLDEGVDTFVGDRGVRLSGGQRQRVGIARALYHNPDILILDEATSALDNDTEKAVMEAIDNLKGKKTIIIIAHRLSTIKKADSVYRVENGKVVLCNKDSIMG